MKQLLILTWTSVQAFNLPYRVPRTISHPSRSPSRKSGNKIHWHRQPLLTSTSGASQEAAAENKLQKLKNNLSLEFVRIGGPALIQLAAEPLASLVDTAYLGRLGPEVLGGAGVAISAQYAVSKLYNDPLLRTSISLVASQDGKTRSGSDTTSSDKDASSTTDQLSIAVSSALLLAATVGLIQCIVYAFGCNAITRGMGLSPGDATGMWYHAVSYLQVRHGLANLRLLHLNACRSI